MRVLRKVSRRSRLSRSRLHKRAHRSRPTIKITLKRAKVRRPRSRRRSAVIKLKKLRRGGGPSWSKVSSDVVFTTTTPKGIQEVKRIHPYNVGFPKLLTSKSRASL